MKLKIGDKVILKTKYGTKNRLSTSVIYRRINKLKQPYAYIVNIDLMDNTYLINSHNNKLTGDYYQENDVESYLKKERKEKLLKIYEK